MGSLPTIAGFEALSDQILVTNNNNELQTPPNHPKLILIYGWGDGSLRHVAKYAEGYQQLFPYSRLVIALSAAFKVLFWNEKQRSDRMKPILEVIGSLELTQNGPSSILVHTMSNTGLTNYGCTLSLFQEKYGYPLPHQLLVMDSTPSTSALDWGNLNRWSCALTFGTYSWFPWPFMVTQYMWMTGLLCNDLYQKITGAESTPKWLERIMNDPRYEMKGSRRLYMYSKEDQVIPWEHIELHCTLSRQEGYVVDTEEFQGSGHIRHMRMSPVNYWKAIEKSWNQPKL